MLQSIDIRDFALIEKLHVDWTPGLNVLTGETGAGKSILMDALNTVLGGKAGASLIRTGADKSYIEAEFTMQSLAGAWLKQHELVGEDSESFIVSREINKSGTRARINGTLVNVSLVQELGQILLTVHAQHESRTLMSPASQLEMLDSLGEPTHKKLIEKCRTQHARRRELASQLKELQMSEEDRTRRLDFSRFQLAELHEAALTSADEDTELSSQQLVLANVNLLDRSVNDACGFISGDHSDSDQRSAIDLLQSALMEVERAAKFDSALNESCEQVKQGLANIEDAARALRKYASNLDTDPEALANVDARIAQLAGIKRKYGPTLEEAIVRTAELEQEIEKLDNSEAEISELSDELSKTDAELLEISGALSKTRKKLGDTLCRSIERELKDLGMERCRFEITMDTLAEPGPAGLDRIEFMIAPNPGQPSQPLGKIASGGELSRIMLAIKSIFASSDQIPTVIFDEIDTGLSGKVLQSMRDKLASLAGSHQILCITHQPIIASIADNHIEVRKEHLQEETKVSAKALDESQRLRSLASMASGEENQDVALQFAQSLVDQANQIRGR